MRYKEKNKNDVVLKVKKSTQSLLPFTEIFSDGVFKVGEKTFCLICEYADTDYVGLTIEEKRHKYDAYKLIMNSLNPDIGYQEFIMNELIDERDYDKVIIPQNMEHLKDKAAAFQDFIDIERDVIKKATSKATYKKTLMSFTYTLKNDHDNYDCLFNQFESIKEALGLLGSNIRQLKIEEVLNCVYKYYHPFDDIPLQIPDNYNKLGKNIKDYIVPMSLKFKSDNIEVESDYTRVLGLAVMTRNQTLSDDFIFNMLDNNYNITVSKYIRRLDKGSVMSILLKREASIEKRIDDVTKENKRTGASTVSSTKMKQLADITEVISELNRGDQEIFEVIVLCSISAETKEELDDITKIIKDRVLSANRAKLKVLTQNQKRAYISMLPFGKNYFAAGADTTLSLHLLTEACGVLIPFSNSLLYNEKGLLYGMDPVSKYPIVIDRNTGINSNGFILSMSGAGKSMFSKMEDLQIVAKYPNDSLIIFDPEGEYARVLGMIDGKEIVFAPTSSNHINPLEITKEEFDSGDLSSLVAEKLELLLALFYAMKGSDITIDEKTVLHNCLNTLYGTLFRTAQLYEDMPTMDSLSALLQKNASDVHSENLHKILSCYMDKGSMLSGRTSVSLTSQYTIFNLSQCQGAWHAIANTLLLYIAENRSRKLDKENKRLWLKVDELHSFVIVNKENNAMSIYLKNTFQRCRKMGHSVQGIMQNVSEAMRDVSISVMVKNSNFVVMLRQHRDDLEILKTLYSLNEKQCNFLLTAQKGEGLIYYDGRIVQFKNTIPHDSLTYKLINTTKTFGNDN